MPVDVQHSIIMEFEEGQSPQPWFPPSGDPPFPATCKRAACNNKSQAGLGPGVQGCTATGGWLVDARQGGGTGKDPPRRGPIGAAGT